MNKILRNKKTAILLASLLVLALAAVGVTVALLMDTSDQVKNTFSPTEVTCEVDEDFNGVKKENVQIKNTGDIDAYIRAAIVVTLRDADDNIAPVALKTDDYTVELGKDWLPGNDGYYYYPSKVASGANTENLIDSLVANESIPAGYHLSVEVIADAIQADGEALEGTDKGKSPVELAWGVTVKDGKLTQ